MATHFEIGTSIHYPPKDKGGKRHGAVGQIANGVGQVVAIRTGFDRGISQEVEIGGGPCGPPPEDHMEHQLRREARISSGT